MGRFLFVVMLLLFCLVPGVRGDEKATDTKAGEKRIRALIRRLDDDVFRVREESEKELARIGVEEAELLDVVIKLLEEAAKSDSAEVRFRAQRALKPALHRIRSRRFASFRGPVITQKNVTKMRLVGELDEDVRRIVRSPDGKRIVFVHWEAPVRILDGKTLRQLDTFTTDRGPIHFAFGPHRDVIAYCENTKVANIHNVRTKKTIEIQPGNSQPKVTFSPDGSLLATGGYGTEAKLWRVSDGTLVKSLVTGRKEGGLWPVFSPDGKRIAIGNRNSTTTIFEVADGKLLHNLPRGSTQQIAFSPDGKILAATYVNAALGLWDLSTGDSSAHKKTAASELYTVAWSPRGDLLVTAGLRGKLTLWHPQDLTILREFDVSDWVISVQFTPDGTRLLTSGGPQSDPKIRPIP